MFRKPGGDGIARSLRKFGHDRTVKDILCLETAFYPL
jgi:hypothetical protein